MAYYADLHSHTTRSDGNDLPYELILNAEKEGVRVVGLTDHDVLPPETIDVHGDQVPICGYAEKHRVRLVRGVEFSCETMIEDCHIVGYGCDFRSAALAELCDRIQKFKESAYIELLEKLSLHGMPITVDELLDANKSTTLADLQKKRIFDLMAQKGYAPDWKSAKLMVRSEKALEVKRKKPDAKEVIEKLHSAGGTAILAHPFLIDEKVVYQGKQMSRWEFIEILIGYGLDGIESRYPYTKTTCVDRRPNEVLWQEIIERYAKRLFISGGSDYHNDEKKGTQNPRHIGECGLTEAEFSGFDQLIGRK